MPAVEPSTLVYAILDAFQDSGGSGILISSARQHPRKFLVQMEDRTFQVWIYAWTLTHGGRPSLPDEYRIQMTTASSPLALCPNGFTLLLGYEPDTGVFAGFDLSRHATFTTGSPSVQIDINCIHSALEHGLAFDRKTNEEIAVAVRTDQMLNYMANATELHRLGRNAALYSLLTKVSAHESVGAAEIAPLTPERRRVLSTVNRWARSASFREQVLRAYGFRCSVTRMQLRLVEAAHIFPVEAEDAPDNVRNGIALSPTYHRAFDGGLIYLDEEFVMRVNLERELQLVTLKLDGGMEQFKSHLNRRIQLPPDKRQWPEIGLIRKANKHRHVRP
jgi:putative restriction endonuclease